MPQLKNSLHMCTHKNGPHLNVETFQQIVFEVGSSSPVIGPLYFVRLLNRGYSPVGLTGQITEEWIPDYLGTKYSNHLDTNYLECVNSFQHSTTIKRLSLKRRPRVALNNVDKTQNGISYSQWHSVESLSSASSDDYRLLGMLSSATRGRPPLPPPHNSALDSKTSRNEEPADPASSHKPDDAKPQPAERSLQRQSPMVKQTVVETRKHLDHDVTNQPAPQPQPRRRLASFGGVSSPGSLSPFTGLGAYNQNNNGSKPTCTGGGMHAHLHSSVGSRGSTGCLRLSPESSGRSTPNLGPIHLQHVRDQMVIALQRLKELEEQVKIIPILQVKVSVLQEEKRQLVSQLKNQSDIEDINDAICKSPKSTERSDIENKVITKTELEAMVKSDLKEFKQLTEEMLEKNIKGESLQACRGKGDGFQNENSVKSVNDKEIDKTLSNPLKENKCVLTDQLEMKSIGTEVSEVHLGIYTERDAEIDAQQLIIGALKDRICHLEAELKESALQTEMSRLKLELHAAGVRNKVDKASFARPSTVGTSIEARPHTTSQGVGNHTEFQDACTGEAAELKTMAICCCRPEVKHACTGPDVPMSHWVIRERVEVKEKGVGMHIHTNSQGVGMDIKLCDVGVNTDVPEESLESKKEKNRYNTVACGDCSVDVIVRETKEMISQGISTNEVKGVDLGIMALPHTASQRTNTVSSSVSRFTNTGNAFITDSSTSTILSTKDKHTNTTQAITRTVSVGTKVKDIKCTPETCTSARLLASALKQTPGSVIKVTRDTGVGFTSINDNFLIGLKTRNMASGPSHLPDPIKTRSIGVGEGRIHDCTPSSIKPDLKFKQSSQSQWDSELNHYIEKMHRLLREHGDLLTENHTFQREGFVLHQNKQESASPKLSSNNKAAEPGGTEIHTPNPPGNTVGYLPHKGLGISSRSGRRCIVDALSICFIRCKL